MAMAKESWGSVCKLPSGQHQAHYRPDGKMAAAPTTSRAKRDAEAHFSAVRADMERDTWLSPVAEKVTLHEYAAKWLVQRNDCRHRTVELYECDLRLQILPVLGDVELARITPANVRDWHSWVERASKPEIATVTKRYRPLQIILNSAAADEPMVRDPCVIRCAGQGQLLERSIPSHSQVFDIADTIEPRFRAMVLVGAFVGMRLGETLALTRERVDLLHGRIKVVGQYQQLKGHTCILGPPKSDARICIVSAPAMLKPERGPHPANFAALGRKGLLFCGPTGQVRRRATWHSAWSRIMAQLGIEGKKPHDLRHMGNTLAAMTGASTKELMAKFGQSTSRTALKYHHASLVRDHETADALNGLIESKLPTKAAPVPRAVR